MTRKEIFKYLDPRVIFPLILSEILTLIVGISVMSVYIILILSSIPIYLFRFVISKTSKYLNPKLGKMITARGQFLAVEKFTSPENSPRSNIVTVLVLDGYVSIEDLRQNFQENFVDTVDAQTGQLRNPEASQYVTSYMGFKYWAVDPHFKIENHVKVVSVSDNEQGPVIVWSQLRDFIEGVVNQSFQPNRSPWEVLILHNYKSSEIGPSTETGTVVILRFHHCLSDGYGALFSILSAISSKPPRNLPTPKYASRGVLRLLLFKLTFPIRMIRDICHFIALSLKDHPWKIRDDEKAWKQLYQASPMIPTVRIKEIKDRFRVSFTSVLHSCLAAAMEKCLVVKYGIQKAKSHNATPCLMILPLPGHPQKLRNYATGAYLYLPTRHMDSVQRLRQCEQDVVLVKKSTMPFVGQFLPVISGSEFSCIAKLLGKNRSFPVSFSNFPIGEVHYEICGRKMLHIYAAAGVSRGVAGLGFLIYSYADHIQISAVGEQAIFSRSDLEILVQTFSEEVDRLHSLSVV